MLLCSISPMAIFAAERKENIDEISGQERIEIINFVIQAESQKKEWLEKKIKEDEPFKNINLIAQLKESRLREIALNEQKIALLMTEIEKSKTELNKSEGRMQQLQDAEMNRLIENDKVLRDKYKIRNYYSPNK